MLQPLLNQTTVPLLEKVAAFAERRQEVLAGNLANIDTPGYKTRDLPVQDFQDALKSAVAEASPRPSLGAASRSAPKSLQELFPARLYQAVEAPPAGLTFQDANNRSIETQMIEMTKNSLLQNFAVELMTAQMAQLQAVITERVSEV